MSKNWGYLFHLGDTNTFKHRFYSPNNFYYSDVVKDLMINWRYCVKSESGTRNPDSHSGKFGILLKQEISCFDDFLFCIESKKDSIRNKNKKETIEKSFKIKSKLMQRRFRLMNKICKYYLKTKYCYSENSEKDQWKVSKIYTCSKESNDFFKDKI